jgi:hypothetical protein
MKRYLARPALTLLLLVAVQCLARSQGTPGKAANDAAKLVGNWTGESICVAKDRPACRDEKVVYRIAAPPDETGLVTIQADKIVDGKPETMYVLDFKYDAAKGTLVGEFTRRNTHGVWEYTVRGDEMEGTLTILPDRTTGRRVNVRKERTRRP